MLADLQVVVEVELPDGSQSLVRVGTARRDGATLVLDLGALRLSPFEPPTAPGLSAPVAGGNLEDLEYIAARARRTLNDASKSRWHQQERVLLRQVEDELARFRDSKKEPA